MLPKNRKGLLDFFRFLKTKMFLMKNILIKKITSASDNAVSVPGMIGKPASRAD